MAGYVFQDMFPNSLDKEINKEFDNSLTTATSDYENIGLKVQTAPEGNSYTESEISGLGNVRMIGEGQGVTFDIPVAGNKKTIGYVKYGLGMGITEEQVQDAIHKNVIKAAGTIGTSSVQRINIDAFDLFNSAFTTQTSWDGAAIIGDHTTLKGGNTITNEVGGGALSATALENLFTYFKGGGSNPLTTEEGFPTQLNPTTLMVSQADWYDAHKLLKGELIVGSDHNDLNTVNPSNGMVSGYKIMTSPFLTSDTAYFMYGGDLDFRLFWKKKPSLMKEADFQTDTMLYKMVMRYATFCMQYKGIAGHTGV